MSAHISSDIVKRIRQLEITTRRLLNSSLVGDSRSAIKGSGLEFDQIREYQQGDDIRFIDWRGSARANKLLVKQYIEERNRTIVLGVDVSASSLFSSQAQKRSDIMAQLAAVLALVAEYGKDQVGLILFSDHVEKVVPLGSGRSHTHALIEALFTHRPRGTRTSLTHFLDAAMKVTKRNGMLCVISDFIDDKPYEKALRTASKKYDIIALRCLDAHEKQLPEVGFVTVQDSETGELCELDMRSIQAKKLRTFLHDRAQAQQLLFTKYGVDAVDIALEKPFMGDIIKFFRRRMTY